MKVIFDKQTEVAYLDEDSIPVRSVDGKHYYLTEADEQELADRQSEWDAGAADRALKAVYAKRKEGYGSVAEQLDIIYHHGLDVWKNHIEEVKLDNPKP